MTQLKRSWVSSANSADTPFPLNNLPYGVFSTDTLDARCGVAIGDMILDMSAVEEAGLINLDEHSAFDLPFWNDVMELGAEVWATLRTRLIEMLTEGSADQPALVPHASRDKCWDYVPRCRKCVTPQLVTYSHWI